MFTKNDSALQKNYEMERHWGVFEPLLDISDENVYQFIEQIVIELTNLFPDEYLHIGGDDISESCITILPLTTVNNGKPLIFKPS